MFNEVHKTDENGFPLIFVKSSLVQVYPCGKRRAQVGNNADTYLPFDPEARLNTEANNRKHTGLNGFTQTYINSAWSGMAVGYDDTNSGTNDVLSLVLDGYMFNIQTNYASASDFADGLISTVQNLFNPDNDADYNVSTGDTSLTQDDASKFTNNAEKIFANIRVQNVPLFEQDELSYKTSVLIKQTSAEDGHLDIYNQRNKKNEIPISGSEQNVNNYYFSGLSFSAKPLTSRYADPDSAIDIAALPYCSKIPLKQTNSGGLEIAASSSDIIDQYVISLCILEKKDGTWQICKQALLPNIKHGSEDNSIELGKVTAESISAESITLGTSSNSATVPSLELFKNEEGTVYRLHFSEVATKPWPTAQ